MAKSYRCKLPKPDKNGDVRPEVGGKRITVGNIRDVSTGEMERRLDAIRDLFDRQCQHHSIDGWSGWLTPYAKKIGKGQNLTLHVSNHARKNNGQASEEAQGLQVLHDLGLDVVPDDPAVIASGEMELKSWIDSSVRDAVATAVADVNDRLGRSLPPTLVERLRSTPPADPSSVETRTFHQTIDAFREYRLKTGKRQDNGKPSPSVQNDLYLSKRLKKTVDDFAIWELDKNKLDELFAHWRNRPMSDRTGKRISSDYAKHIMDCLWAIFVWLDEADWKWEYPKGARRIKRTTEPLDSDRKKRRSRRISGNTYNPDQLVLIAQKLDKFGKLILGVSVNCAMQPAEIGRLEADDCYQEHPETQQKGHWIVLDRAKTHEYGEWLLWPEVAELVLWGKQRAEDLGCERLIVSKG